MISIWLLRFAVAVALSMLPGSVILTAAATVAGAKKFVQLAIPPGDSFVSGISAQMHSRSVDTRVQLEILEGQPRGAVVGFVPTKQGFTYRFNEPPREFVINGTTGEIRTTAVLDRETLKSDRFDLVVLSSQPTYPIEVRILVQDINDNAPEFPESSLAVSFSESAAAGTKLLLDTATDRDTPVNGVSNDYRIIAGNDEEKFRLQVTANPSGDTSYLYLQTTGKLDRESKAFYHLNISARDSGIPTHFGYLLVNVTILDANDNPPIFAHSDYSVSLNESAPIGTKVIHVLATDADDGDNAKVTYYLSETERRFSVDPETGQIFTADILDCSSQNCPLPQQGLKSRTGKKCPKSCVFTIYARDHGSPQQDGRAYVTVNLLDSNDHDPVIKFSYFPSTSLFATVDENAANGSVVAAVSVVDPDEGLNGDTEVTIKSGNELGHFRVEYAQSFDIIRVNGILDREHINKYNLTVVAADKGDPSRTATSFLIIHVNDINDHEPVFEKSEYSSVMSELSPVGSYVAGITATDEDSGVNAMVYYSIVSGNDHDWFEISAETGLVTTKKGLDREKQGTVELRISAHDGGPNPKWTYTQLKVIILDENDEVPSFSKSALNVSVLENAREYSIIATLTATDHDQGTNGSIAYALAPETSFNYPDTFSVDSLTGQIWVRGKLDRETTEKYVIAVLAKDQGNPPQSSTATIFLTLQDVNDNCPIFYPKEYFYNYTNESGIRPFHVLAHDADEGDNAVVRYSITGSDGEDLFHINEKSGEISLKSSTEFLKNHHRITVAATDEGNRKCNEKSVVEIINCIPNEDMHFSADAYSFRVEENSELDGKFSNREIGRVQILFKSSIRKDVRFYIVAGDATQRFKIDVATGTIETKNFLDREQQSAYNLRVVARSGMLMAETMVNVTITDVNDSHPQFTADKSEVKISENAAVGQEVFLVRAKDRDSGVNSRVSYALSANPENQFRISENTGVIYLNKPLRSRPGALINLEIKASDSGKPMLWSKHQVAVMVTDVNDHTPVFDRMIYETSLLESTPINERFFKLQASDQDYGMNGMIAYEVAAVGNTDEKFGIFPDGYVFIRKRLDREERDYYCVTVTATDGGNPARSSTASLIIYVIDENDNKPEFANGTFNFWVKENEPADTFVGKLVAFDNDMGRNAELVFSLSNGKNDFTIDRRNGFIRTLRPFDREQLVHSTGQNVITLEAIVTDGGTPRLRDKVKVNVFITDVNDNPPEFSRLPYKVSISENSPIGTQVIRVFTTDADEGLNRDVFYFISKGNKDKHFSIDEATGQIIVSKSLDREISSRYVLTVTAYDAAVKSSLSSQVTVTIDVSDENDNAPAFEKSESYIFVSENFAVNGKLHQFSAVDPDLGINSEISYSIGSGNRRDTFQIDPVSGILYLRKKLDYEDITSYLLNITAYDRGNPRLFSTLLFTVAIQDFNDNPPAFPNTAIVRQIRENIPVNTPIVTVMAEDPDSDINGKIVYSMVKEEPENVNRSNKSFHFQINPTTGIIHTVLPIDREVTDTFRLTILATDQAVPQSKRLSAQKIVTVIVEDVNDNAPIFISMNAALLPTWKWKSSPVTSKEDLFVMNVLATDADSSTNGLVTYDFIGGDLDFFHLHRTTGVITLKKPITDPTFKYQLSVKATDEAVQSERRSTETYISIINPGNKNAEIFFDKEDGTVFENEPIGTNILTVKARHRLNPQCRIEYYITDIFGNGHRKENRLFDIDTKLGIISTASILDREAASQWYELEIYAIALDTATPMSAVVRVRIDVLDKNDSPPFFGERPLEFSVSEDLPTGHVVTTIKATDADTPTRIAYSLLASEDDAKTFSLDPDTGVLRLTDSLDREVKMKHILRVQASDGVQKTEATLTVAVTDTNDNAPVFSASVYSFDVHENAARGAKIGQVSATDEDEDGPNSVVTYTVISDWANDVFSLNSHTGLFTLASKLDYEQVQHYIFTVQAQDSGRPSLSSTVTVYLNVIDLNDNQPSFQHPSYNVELFENATIGSTVISVSASDMDSGENGRLEYSLMSPMNDKDLDFSIDGKNGTIWTRRVLDRERKSHYTIVVLATDQAKAPQQRLSAATQVSIIIKDVNDVSPEFSTGNETWVMENSPMNTIVTLVKAVDRDEGRDGYLEYSLVDHNEGLFVIGLTDGLIRVNGKLDRETKANYTLKIKVYDRGEMQRATELDLLVNVLDENDNSPVFNLKQYSANVPENVSIGLALLQVFADDPDEGLNGKVRYSIWSGDENRDFSIGEDTGLIRVAKNLNYERKNKYWLTIRAEDGDGDAVAPELESRFDTAVISITLTDINDNFPVFLDSPYEVNVIENTVPYPGGCILRVNAYDADSAPYNSQLRYFLKDTPSDYFRINATTGEIFLLKPLDREKRSEFVMTVVAMDAGNPPLTGSGIVNVLVQDTNDHSPQFDRSHYVAHVVENLPATTEVIQIIATDADAGLNAKIRYSLLGENMGKFKVDVDSGLITTRFSLDREERAQYHLMLVAQDCSISEAKVSAVNLTIFVTDENDNAPIFLRKERVIYIPDKTGKGDFVFGVLARDLDSGENSRLTYTMRGPSAANFILSEKTGVIKAARSLRSEVNGSEPNFKISVECSDNGRVPLTSAMDLDVKLIPPHLFPSIIPLEESIFSLAEDAAIGKILTKVRASSPKSGTVGVIKYSIAGGNLQDAFKVDAITGEFGISGKLDYESVPQYDIWVEARDSDVIPLRSVVKLYVNVTDVNDNAPIMDAHTYKASILEEERPPQLVTRVKATDNDSGLNGKVSYKLKSDANGAFRINSETGEIFTNARLDREDVFHYQLVVEASDQGTGLRLTSTAVVLVTVLDKNDSPPRFTRLFSVNVTENAERGSFVVKVTSSDLDAAENSNATYSLTENPGNKFAVDALSGNVTVTGQLDREVEDEYLLKVVAVDGSWRAETPITITIQDQNDNSPEFEKLSYSFYTPETKSNMMLMGQVNAQDRDKPGPNSAVMYYLKHPSEFFSIDPATGEIFSKNKLSYKTYFSTEISPENEYGFTIVAADNGKPPMSSECKVTINVVNANNNAPKFEQREYYVPVPYNGVVGQRIIRLFAIDPDFGVNAEVEYSKMEEGNGTDFFAVSKSGWIILTKDARDAKILSKFTLNIKATDRGIPAKSDRASVILVVCGNNNYSPVFSALSYRVIVPENEPVGTAILTVNAADNDEGPNGIVRYFLNQTGLAREDEKFRVDATTGVVSIVQPLDYDDVNEYKLSITASDLSFEPKIALATLTVVLTDINDNAPTFNQSVYEASLIENAIAGSFVTQLKASDKDSAKYSIVNYAIVGGTGKDVFKIDAKSGVVTSAARFDFEEKDIYILEILATNPDSPMYGSTTVIVHIKGENEYYPRFVQPVFHFDVSESAALGTSVGVVQATDQDAGEDGNVNFLFVGSSNDKGFQINWQTGAVTVARRLDRETQNRVVLTVMAKNSGSIRGNDTDEAQVIISIQDGNDPPEFYKELYEVDLSEGCALGTKVVTVHAFDKDIRSQHNQFTYSIIDGNVGKSFKIDSHTGEIETISRLDRENISKYSLVVAAIDTGFPPETGTTTVKIVLSDVNDNGPILDPTNTVGYILENEPAGSSIFTLAPKDVDLPINGAPFTFALIGGTHENLVSLESHTGILRTTQSINREINPQLNILVSVEDSGDPKMKSIYSISVVVLDQNDSPSTPRTAHILVNAFEQLFPIGKISDVYPNDLDITGDYSCKLLNDPTPRGVLSVTKNCELHASRIAVGNHFTLNTIGNDGKHAQVTSSFSVEFRSFTNTTIDNSVTIRVENTTSARFVARYYKQFNDILLTAFNVDETPMIFSFYDNNDGLEISIVVKDGDASYRNSEYSKQRLNKKYNNFKQLLQTDLILDYSPCANVTCQHNGICNEEMIVTPDTKIVDSPGLVFTSPVVKKDFACYCQDGYIGKKCERRQDPCSPNPCQADGVCRRQGSDFQCQCPSSRVGIYCEEERSDKCRNNPCQNGGSCRESPDKSNFFCLCRLGYRGNHCEVLADSCRPNPCMSGGSCISLKPGYKCNCPEGSHGRHCEKSTFGFGDLSYMTFAPLDSNTNDISITFATTKSDSLLIYNYGTQTGGRSDFVALELVNGKAVFSYGGARTAITSILVPVGESSFSLADGNWYKITATRNGRLVSLSVASCLDNGDDCKDCMPGDPSCYADSAGLAGTLNFNGNHLHVGGVSNSDAILERPGQVHSDDFVGCIHSVQINGRFLNLSNALKSYGVGGCNRSVRSLCGLDHQSPCGYGMRCFDLWKKVNCECHNSNFIAPNCDSALEPITLTEGAFVEFKISEKHRRFNLLESIYRGSTLWHSRYADYKSADNVVKSEERVSAKSERIIVFSFRTIRSNGVLLYLASNKDFTVIEMVNSQLIYKSRVGKESSANMSIDTNEILSDGQWHTLKLHAHRNVLKIYVDGDKVGEELDFESVHNFLDSYLTTISIGGIRPEIAPYPELIPKGFSGCFANFSINGEVQPFGGDGSIFSDVVNYGKVSVGCSGPVVTGAVSTPDPLRIGVSLVIVFFMILLVAILVSFVVFRLRKQIKEKTNLTHTKQNGGGGSNLINTSGGMTGDIIRTALHNDSSPPLYMTENGEIMRGVNGHHMVAPPELISKRFKDQDMPTLEQIQKSQRPDIIEREVVGKSPPPREEMHPPHITHRLHDSQLHSVADSEMPEHYDLENSSSIAPSDIDIIYHYKSYRDGANLRKYKPALPHLPPPGASIYHKHNMQQHRHSPHHGGAFSPHLRESPRNMVNHRPPPPSSRVESPKQMNMQHQSTPLARLSPSSEISQQMPRILTLQDISGKPLQSALLATTSSSGGVGKDALHTNSERSLNSPVMSQLSGQSSTESRKIGGPPSQHGNGGNGGLDMRMNARNASLANTLDAVSLPNRRTDPMKMAPQRLHRDDHNRDGVCNDDSPATSSDESGNDSFTCSEIEYDNGSVAGEKLTSAMLSNLDNEGKRLRRPGGSGGDGVGGKKGVSSGCKLSGSPYGGGGVEGNNYDSFCDSLSTLVASDTDISRVNSLIFRSHNASPSSIPTNSLGWEYLLNWGPNFQNFASVFKDIAELPDTVNDRVMESLCVQNNTKTSEEYV